MKCPDFTLHGVLINTPSILINTPRGQYLLSGRAVLCPNPSDKGVGTPSGGSKEDLYCVEENPLLSRRSVVVSSRHYGHTWSRCLPCLLTDVSLCDVPSGVS